MRFIMVTTQVLLVNKYNYILETIIFFTVPFYFFIVLTKRITKGIHTSMFGAVLIDSPLFSYFFVMFAHLHPKKIFNPTIVLTISLFSYKFIYYLYQIFLRKYAYLILNEQYEPPFWLPINNCLVMRIAAETDADITQFENYMNLRLKQDPDEMIEVVRFLGIFRNQRERLLLMMSKFKGDSVYYEFQFYCFMKAFMSIEDSCPQKYISSLDKMHTTYLVYSSLFWDAKSKGDKIGSFIYALKASIPRMEIIDFANLLRFAYQKDYYIHQAMAELSLIALGEPSKYVKFSKMYQKLKENPSKVSDQIFIAMRSSYPITLSKYFEELNAESKSEKSDSENSSSLRFHVSEKTIYREDNSLNSPVAMFVQKVSYFKPYGIVFSPIVGMIWLGFYFKKLMDYPIMMTEKMTNVKMAALSTYNLTSQIASGVMLQPFIIKAILHNQKNENITKSDRNSPPNKENTINENIIKSDIKFSENINKNGKDSLQNIGVNNENTKSVKVIHDITKSDTNSPSNKENTKISENINKIYSQNTDITKNNKVIQDITKSDKNKNKNNENLNLNDKIIQDITKSDNSKQVFNKYIGKINDKKERRNDKIDLKINDENDKCSEFYNDVYDFINEYMFSYKEDYQFRIRCLAFISHYVATNKCDDILDHTKLMRISAQKMRENYLTYSFNVRKISTDFSFYELQKVNMAWLFSVALISMFLVFNTVFWKTNMMFRDLPKTAINFLASKERLGLLLFKKSLETYDLLKLLLTNKNANQDDKKNDKTIDRRIKVAKYSSEMTISEKTSPKNNHVNLRGAKLTVSFIGADQLLRPSQFALRSPIVSSCASLESENDEEENSVWSDKSELDKKLFEPEKIESLDIVNKTIESVSNESKNYKVILLLLIGLPWVCSFSIVLHTIFVLNSQQNSSLKLIRGIQEHIENLHSLPQEMYLNYTSMNYRSNFSSENLIQNISTYARSLIPIIDEIDAVNFNSVTGLFSWLIAVIIYLCLMTVGVYYFEKNVCDAFNSYFHFPIGFIDDLNKKIDNDVNNSLSDNILELTITNDSHLIFNLSSNCEKMLGVSPIEIIGQKYEEMFPMNAKNQRTFWAKKNKKFIEKQVSFKKITRVILYDKYDDKNDIVNLLSQHIPHEIAKIYCEEGNISCCESQGYFMVCKYNNTEYNSSIEQVFKSIHNIMQCYSTVHLIGIEGSILRFVFRGSDRSVPLFFIRDLLNISVCNHHLDNFVVFCGSISSEIVIRDEEPYVFSFVSSQSKSESASFYVCNRSILFVDDCLHLCEEFSGEIIEGNHSLRGFQIKFEDLENVVCNIY
ncbi:hypothetical protein TVAG_524380 [Trichomonas vaginalis G3]|uniref:PAS domain-containing protein n=1 Tax=Trichomonas vaginalis (strain ATCC PRA-98 / G3) TaxID=412133 RepID=A2G810_TRIV3|nr:hypothetical protein TVAGG3_0788030 [Trichomonas vaginalis G3]EAX86705.1 hypothetical protein TVAG_524380 [Trichomonas vaginalis G3]KAI5495545.1 hypothetical protein TVAGG3_0788030 [Trichomonas vaginalis G3]|eukprot:XP_001299635.1 hypothetical protein [Trichomonas vaginalis G3]